MTRRNPTKPEWPRHPDGRQKTMGEMTRAEQDAQLGPILDDLKREMNGPDSPFRKLTIKVGRKAGHS